MNVYSGHKVDPLHIKEEDIYLEDIAQLTMSWEWSY